MDRNDIEEMAKDLTPQAEESNAGQVLMTIAFVAGYVVGRKK